MDVVSVLSIFAFLLSGVFSLTYNYGDGSYYVGEVDNYGLPKGTGKFYNTSGNLGKRRRQQAQTHSCDVHTV